ncbi:hypothetical protein AJ80_06150 [Polytolypa hystricis UAMH7299]|uniref:Uncharacterized protein n=1 Tax=Polytolypa hystricis (strain UAMH7299) TaxID=1447883 RepID=A0A2B7XYN0_POLH7|nr:hypothetical protein AJ80_06150 [Polytolypa hystricis UAMH7299]
MATLSGTKPDFTYRPTTISRSARIWASSGATSANLTISASADFFQMQNTPNRAEIKSQPTVEYTTLQSMTNTINNQYNILAAGSQNQYLYFTHVSAGDFQSIENERHRLRTHERFTYFPDIETLIIKIPTREHEVAYRSLGKRITSQVEAMGLGEDEFLDLGSTKFVAQNSSTKESDGAWLNLQSRPNRGDWPSFVIEAGYSEGLERLHSDARCWIENSAGQVRIVLLLSIRPSARSIVIEKWELGSGPSTSNMSPVQTANLTVTSTEPQNITGSVPLVLEFNKIFGRAPVALTEHDLTFTAQDLTNWADIFWRAM